MQVSKQMDSDLLSLSFLFHKHHVRDDGGDGEQPDAIIILALFRNTTLILEVLAMHLPAELRIEKLHYLSPAIWVKRRGLIVHCLIKADCLTLYKARYLYALLLDVTLDYISFSWRFYPKRLTINAFNHEGINPEQQESSKYKFLQKSQTTKCCM